MTIDPKRLHEAKRKARKRCPRRNYWDDESWERNLKKARKVTTPCSCAACRNGRRKGGYNKGKCRKTIQERRHEQDE